MNVKDSECVLHERPFALQTLKQQSYEPPGILILIHLECLPGYRAVGSSPGHSPLSFCLMKTVERCCNRNHDAPLSEPTTAASIQHIVAPKPALHDF